jgi:hypothetical protein
VTNLAAKTPNVVARQKRELWKSVPCGRYHSSRRPAPASPGRKLESPGWLSTFTVIKAGQRSISKKTRLRIRIHFIRIQHFRLNTDPDPDAIRIQGFNDQKFKKITVENFFLFFLDQKLQFTYP